MWAQKPSGFAGGLTILGFSGETYTGCGDLHEMNETYHCKYCRAVICLETGDRSLKFGSLLRKDAKAYIAAVARQTLAGN